MEQSHMMTLWNSPQGFHGDSQTSWIWTKNATPSAIITGCPCEEVDYCDIAFWVKATTRKQTKVIMPIKLGWLVQPHFKEDITRTPLVALHATISMGVCTWPWKYTWGMSKIMGISTKSKDLSDNSDTHHDWYPATHVKKERKQEKCLYWLSNLPLSNQ